MQRKPLPKPSKNNAQIKEYTGAVQRGQKGYYVAPSKSGWSVKKANAARPSGNFATKAAAISYVKKSADPRADIVIFGKDGKITVVEVKSR
ncbi:MAG TPA: DUF2188 domain-containing protein [Candidatus Saccharimonadales bacterium]|nr:DUF2188 domain-containing protein [Candidatus Saccharimonadales bacterium]